MKVRDLPVYTEYPEKNYELEMRPLNSVEKQLLPYIKPARVEMQRWCSCLKKVTTKYQSRISSMGSCGIFRKMLYATMSASLATAACYPSATLHYSRTAWEHSKQRIGALKDEFSRKK
ncbi:hypothetical protein D915_005240 [Fasciola hepatica]|uniref:MICOS complex subunit n=1 Tax=Fasciola hepatica TaxID=6192 RepID=A0A4E0RCI6_FASHE|nr:hypothetical protein D915_005240 [Fasciola hepatica]